jgi:hypothetical protein
VKKAGRRTEDMAMFEESWENHRVTWRYMEIEWHRHNIGFHGVFTLQEWL